MTQYAAPFITEDCETARSLDHIMVQVAKDRVRYAFDASEDSLQDDRTLGLVRVPTRCQQAAVALVGTLVHHCLASVRAEATRMFWEIAGGHGICPAPHYPVPEFATLVWATGSIACPKHWLLWGWDSTTPSSVPVWPMSSCSPPQAMSSRCVPPRGGTTTRAA